MKRTVSLAIATGLLSVCVLMLGDQASYTKTRVASQQDEMNKMVGIGQDAYSKWKAKHFADVGESRNHSSLIVVTKRLNSTDAMAQVTFVSTEKAVFEISPNIEIFAQPIEIKYNADGSEQKLEAGPATQLRSAKNSPNQKGKSGKLAELVIALQADSNASFLEVTTKIIGDINNRSYVSIVPLQYEFSSMAIGGSTSEQKNQSSSVNSQLPNSEML